MVIVYVAILASPFVIGLAIAASSRARAFITRHYVLCIAAGWTAFALAVPVAAVLDGALRVGVLAIVCPLLALTIWQPGDGPDGDDDDHGGGGGGSDPGPAPTRPPAVDWDRFMRDVEEYAASARR